MDTETLSMLTSDADDDLDETLLDTDTTLAEESDATEDEFDSGIRAFVFSLAF